MPRRLGAYHGGVRPHYPIRTARLELRPFADADLSDLHAYCSLPEVARYLYWEPLSLPESRERLRQLKTMDELSGEGSSLVLAAALPGGGVIGQASLVWRSRWHRQGELGFVFHPGFQGRGYAGEAARAMLELGFSQLELHRVYARCDVRNRPSWRLMQRLGMRREAHFVHRERFKGEWAEEFVYALLEDEWRQGRAANRARTP